MLPKQQNSSDDKNPKIALGKSQIKITLWENEIKTTKNSKTKTKNKKGKHGFSILNASLLSDILTEQ